MKNKLLLLFLSITQLIIAQQVTLLQPALRDSDMKLDYLEVSFTTTETTDILYARILYSNPDAEKNPTRNSLTYFDTSGNIINSFTQNVEYYLLNEFNTENSNNEIFLPVKSNTLFIENTITNEFIIKDHYKYIKDEKFGFIYENVIEELRRFFDEEFNLTTESLNEVILLNDLPIEKLFYEWNSNTNNSELSYKEIYHNTFENNNFTERITTRVNDFVTNIELNFSKETFNYSTNLGEIVFYYWNESNNWQELIKKTKTYNATNKPIEINTYIFSNSQWMARDKEEFTYNELGLLINIIEKDNNFLTKNNNDFIYNEDNLLTEFIKTNYQNGIFNHSISYKFFYSPENSASITDINTKKLKLYPNPITTILNIESEEELDYKIYSIQGKLIKKGTALQKINLSSLEKGMYFIYLKTNTLNITQKIIKE